MVSSLYLLTDHQINADFCKTRYFIYTTRSSIDYGGEGDGEKEVALTDTLPLAGLDADVTVADIMDTEAGGLCYRYMYI